MSEPALPHYALGSTDAEHRRLLQLASHEEDRVADACRRAREIRILDNGIPLRGAGC
jgi:hypothetical protein